MRISRIFRTDDGSLDEPIPVRRMLLWALVWIGVLVGVVLYFQYARLLVPLLG
ncbi:MAG: hypothetical protein V4550_05730 [Gemmatimonadota bacterium]